MKGKPIRIEFLEAVAPSTPTSSSTVTAVSGRDREVVGRRSVRTGETRRWRTSTIRKNYDDATHESHMPRYTDFRSYHIGHRGSRPLVAPPAKAQFCMQLIYTSQ
ncbi:hypothetical protein EVAR_96614_1 [Eumeta japonica]|uniref:Uncharacterized protein n=1 Tax=Eumeta variegata TaxID=151549 RepID=A0A4C1WR08_EUMVA|nr:hypothetical protein EVAR_96614_1 [Eumeta japonica]